MLTCRIIQFLSKLRFLSEHLTKSVFICCPIRYRSTCYPTLNSRLGYCRRNFCYKTRVYRFRNKIKRTECQIVHMIYIIDNIRNWLLCQIRNGIYCCEFHLLIDCRSMYIKRATEYIRETDNIVYLVRIVRTSCTHKYIRTTRHSILIRNFRYRIGKCKHDRLVCH